MSQAQVRRGEPLSYDRLAWETKALPEWLVHPSGLSMTREASFPSSGPALLFVAVAGCVARLERRWPVVAFQGERVWITVRNLDRGLSENDLALARELEIVLRQALVAPAPSPPLGPGSLAQLEELTVKTAKAIEDLVASLRRAGESSRPSGHAAMDPHLRMANKENGA